MSLTYVKPIPIALKEHPQFNESWLQDRIAEDPSILGLGDLDVLKKERKQLGAGRLDLLLTDRESETWYETEIMLGATDPSHIIRCIEYWDIERRRYPGYEHIAVLVAEEITARFLNVISLLSGTLPIVAIQLNALQVGNQIVLNFVKVLDQRGLRIDEVDGGDEPETDRNYWINKKGDNSVQICDQLLEMANQVASPSLELKYKKTRIALSTQGAFFNVGVVYPKKGHVLFVTAPNSPEDWVTKLDDAGLDAQVKGNRVKLRLTTKDLTDHQALLRSLVQQAVVDFKSDS
jgi:hypothetical protein